MKKFPFSSLLLFIFILLSVSVFSQKEVRFDLSSSTSISPNLGLSEDTIKFELSLENPDNHILFFRSHSYDYFSVANSAGIVLLSNENYQKGVQQLKISDSLEVQKLQVKILSGEQVLVPMVVSDEEEILNENKIKDAFYLFFAGIFVSIILYNLFLFVFF